MTTVLIVEYNKLFGEEPQPLNYYLDGIGRSKLLLIGSHFLGFDAHNPRHLDYESFLNDLFTKNVEFKLTILGMLDQMKQNASKELLIINTVSSLELFQYAFDHANDQETQSEVDIEKNIFLAYLALNQKTRKMEDNIFPSIQNLSLEEQAAALFFTQSYGYSNLINYNRSELIVTQLIKSAFLFEFLMKTTQTQALFNAFLADYGFKEWKEYLIMLFPFVSGIVNNEREGFIDFTVTPGARFKKDCEFIDKLILPEGSIIEDYDFKKIRECPFYKIEEGKYRVIMSLFVIEKIYKALYFKLAVLNNGLSNSVSQLKSFLGDEFSEKTLAYEILDSIYKKNYITFTGQQSKDLKVSSEPDYYLRKGKRVFLFESKDFLIDASIKTSYDFHKIKEAFEKKLLRDHKKRAVPQLLENCKRILTKTFTPDQNYESKKVIIYPIILLHDNQYNVLGLNHVVNAWFEHELQAYKNNGLRTEAIRPVSIINIDTFIYHQDLFRDRDLKLEDILEAYIKHSSLKNLRYKSHQHLESIVKRRLMPFSIFLSDIDVVKRKARVPKMLMDKVGVLFKKN
jgi:hypothetical protein